MRVDWPRQIPSPQVGSMPRPVNFPPGTNRLRLACTPPVDSGLFLVRCCASKGAPTKQQPNKQVRNGKAERQLARARWNRGIGIFFFSFSPLSRFLCWALLLRPDDNFEERFTVGFIGGEGARATVSGVVRPSCSNFLNVRLDPLLYSNSAATYVWGGSLADTYLMYVQCALPHLLAYL